MFGENPLEGNSTEHFRLILVDPLGVTERSDELPSAVYRGEDNSRTCLRIGTGFVVGKRDSQVSAGVRESCRVDAKDGTRHLYRADERLLG